MTSELPAQVLVSFLQVAGASCIAFPRSSWFSAPSVQLKRATQVAI